MRKRLSRYLFVFAVMGIVSPGDLRAWGPEGHASVCDIAEHSLTPVAQEIIRSMLGTKKLRDPAIAVWPDIIRGNKEYEAKYPRNGRWHYVDFDTTLRYDDDFELRPSEDGHNVVDQIRRWRKELANPDASPEQRLDALRFVVHFVGDVHQPLHCAYRYGDMGGNMIPVHTFTGNHYSFDADTPMDFAPNLHSTWDTYLVIEAMAGARTKTFANRLARKITPEQAIKWIDDDPLKWAIDSYWVARKKAYRWTNGEPLPATWSRPGMDLTADNYIDSKLPLVREQLQKAGVRLAHVLNAALDPDYAAPAPPERNLPDNGKNTP